LRPKTRLWKVTPHFIEPGWTLPGVSALSTTRGGGESVAPWDGFNVGHHVGDSPDAVNANRAVLRSAMPAATAIQWLQQVHGIDVVKAEGRDYPEADACWTDQPGIACAVMTADCLPVLLASEDGAVVAAAHAGWRGLLAGVLEKTVAAMDVDPLRLLAWLGPAIGPESFEVGPEVRDAFLDANPRQDAFVPGPRPGHYLANIYHLARYRLAGAGVNRLHGGNRCTFKESSEFFSYRRDRQTGRMASVIMINPPG
jgi:purine-nucleoside/S-methyl-5'-thioadenosine phosphorylase / adenosine deaminase